jgi:hypothetical protein
MARLFFELMCFFAEVVPFTKIPLCAYAIGESKIQQQRIHALHMLLSALEPPFRHYFADLHFHFCVIAQTNLKNRLTKRL